MKNENCDRKNFLKGAAETRRNDVMNYQINIDNFRLAIKKIEKDYMDKPHMVDFSYHLKNLLQSSIEEQDKEKLMLDVIEQQLGED